MLNQSCMDNNFFLLFFLSHIMRLDHETIAQSYVNLILLGEERRPTSLNVREMEIEHE